MESIWSPDGTRIAYEDRGVGQHLVTVSGALSDHAAALALAPDLGDQFTIRAFDRRGRGLSGANPPYAVEREIEDLGGVVRTAPDRPWLYGHSSGAMLALRAVLDGLCVEALVLHEPPFILDGTRSRPDTSLARRLQSLVDAGDRERAVDAFLQEGVGLPAAVVEGIRGTPLWSTYVALAHTVPFDAAVAGDCRIPADLSAVRVPTLVLLGGASPDWMQASARALVDALPDGRLAVLAGQGHNARPDLVASEVLAFADSLEAIAAGD